VVTSRVRSPVCLFVFSVRIPLLRFSYLTAAFVGICLFACAGLLWLVIVKSECCASGKKGIWSAFSSSTPHHFITCARSYFSFHGGKPPNPGPRCARNASPTRIASTAVAPGGPEKRHQTNVLFSIIEAACSRLHRYMLACLASFTKRGGKVIEVWCLTIGCKWLQKHVTCTRDGDGVTRPHRAPAADCKVVS
jgi:hypothetical protein